MGECTAGTRAIHAMIGLLRSAVLEGTWPRHLAAAVAFVGLALVWTFPLVRHLNTHVSGRWIGDNVISVWNFWWMRAAVAAEVSPFQTTHLFAPFGVDLTLHTHTALPAFIGATVIGALPLVAAHNVALLATVALNGCAAYALAWRLTRDHGAAFIAGLVFGGSPYMTAHLHGHFNLVSAWTIPLLAIAGTEWVRGSLAWGALAGVLLGITAYLDYYYVLYGFVLLLCLVLFAARDWRLVRVPPGNRAVWLTRATGALLMGALTAIAAIIATGGFTTQLGPLRISAHEIFNPLQAFWILLLIYAALRLGIRVRTERREEFAPVRVGRAFVLMLASFSMTSAPLALNAFELIRRGDYVTQQYFWRSSPNGIDLATLLLGNPFHPVWGDGVLHLYERAGIDLIESTAWLGIAPLALAAWVLARHWRKQTTAAAADETRSGLVRQWMCIGGVFFIWALGSHLTVWGTNTGMILPQAILRYVPLVDNARMPGRAMVVVCLAMATLAGLAAAERRAGSRRPALWLLAITLAVSVDYLPAPFPLASLERPAIYEALRMRTEDGNVCELPLGLRDGFGERGTFDEGVLFYQTLHGRPLVGGFVARLPASVAAAYEADPLISYLLGLSNDGTAAASDAEPPSADVATTSLRANRIRWIVLDRQRASARLLEYAEGRLPLTLVAQDGERSLYLVNVVD
jgi:hypothetical protein